MRANGCFVNLLSVGVLLAGTVWGVQSCVNRQEEARNAEEQRRASLTPEQRAAEDRATSDQAAKEQSQQELARREVSAERVSKEFILKFLKHPDDATFGFWDIPDVKHNLERDVFYISSKVKAKNDFGGELTYRWETIVTLDGATWKLVSCVIDGKAVYESDALMSQLKERQRKKGFASNQDASTRSTSRSEPSSSLNSPEGYKAIADRFGNIANEISEFDQIKIRRVRSEIASEWQKLKGLASEEEFGTFLVALLERAKQPVAQDKIEEADRLVAQGQLQLAILLDLNPAASPAESNRLSQNLKEIAGKLARLFEVTVDDSNKEKWHSWTSNDGNYTVRAKFVKSIDQVVYLEKEDGTQIKVPRDKLSDDDWIWITHRGWTEEKSK